jgi:hypothetical protein
MFIGDLRAACFGAFQPLTANPSTAESCMHIEIAGLIGERIDNDGKGRDFVTRAAIKGIKK